MNTTRIRQVAKLAGVSEDTVRLVITAELLRVSRELLINKRKWAIGIYGDLVPLDADNYDVCQTKLDKELLDMVEGNTNLSIIKSI